MLEEHCDRGHQHQREQTLRDDARSMTSLMPFRLPLEEQYIINVPVIAQASIEIPSTG